MKTEEIIKEINTIMFEYEGTLFRPIPYLGWIWRDIEPNDLNNNTIRFSKPDGGAFYYLDMAWKWDYPYIELSLEEAHPILEKMLEALKTSIELTNILKANDKMETEK